MPCVSSTSDPLPSLLLLLLLELLLRDLLLLLLLNLPAELAEASAPSHGKGIAAFLAC